MAFWSTVKYTLKGVALKGFLQKRSDLKGIFGAISSKDFHFG